MQPANGSQKLIEVEDERKLRVFMDKRYAHRFAKSTESFSRLTTTQNGRRGPW